METSPPFKCAPSKWPMATAARLKTFSSSITSAPPAASSASLPGTGQLRDLPSSCPSRRGNLPASRHCRRSLPLTWWQNLRWRAGTDPPLPFVRNHDGSAKRNAGRRSPQATAQRGCDCHTKLRTEEATSANTTENQVRAHLEGSLKRLGTDHVDLYYADRAMFRRDPRRRPGVPSGWRSIRHSPAASRRRQRQSSRPPRRIDHNLRLRLGVRK
jgi:hypothetical protein